MDHRIDLAMSDKHTPTLIPDELDLLEFFESEPIKSNPNDGFWCYEFTDERGICIRVSWDIFEQSIQTIIISNGEPIETVVHEGAKELRISYSKLEGYFDLGADLRLVIQLKPKISVQWSGLRKYE